MANLRVKTVELLCVLAAIAAPSTLFAKTSVSIDVSQAVKTWQRQKAASEMAEQEGIFTAPPVGDPKKPGTMSLGGPGLDGGGGVGVITSQGQLRILDLAVGNGTPLVSFNKENYRQIMSRKGNFVSNKGTHVSNAEFFSCAFERLQQQDNILLQFLKPENMRLTVAFTDLPLNRGSLRPSKIVFPSPTGSGFAWEVTQLPASNLYSPSVPYSYQKPIASYAVQATIKAGPAIQVLLVSSQMYQSLSWKDRCALQVHELLRYISNVGNLGTADITLLLKRHLSTTEIEKLTRKIIDKQPVYLSEIPATNFYKYLAVNGSEQFAEGAYEQIHSALYTPEDDNQLSPSEAEYLYSSMGMSILLQQAQEDTMMQLGRDHFHFKTILNEQKKKLKGKRYRISDIVF